MDPKITADSGTEWAIGPAKRILARLKAQGRDLKQSSLKQVQDLGSGVMAYIQAGEFVDRIQITGGTWACSDPVQSLWGIASALLPSERILDIGLPQVTPIVQHVTTTYLERPRTLTTTNGETYNPGNPWTPPSTTPGATVTVRMEKTIKHELVICRYCRRVATYTWDEVWTYDDATFMETGVDSGYAKTGVFDRYDYVDGPDDINQEISVTTYGVTSDGTEVADSSSTILTTLVADAIANPWGWYGEGSTPQKPVLPVMMDAYSYGVYAANYGAGPSTYLRYPDGSHTLITSYGAGSFIVGGGGIAVNPDGTNLNNYWAWMPSLQPGPRGAEAYAAFLTDAAMALALTAAAHTTALAKYEVDVKAHLDAIIAILTGIAAMLDDKLITDATEIVPCPFIPYKNQQAAYVIPAKSTYVVTATYNGISKDYTFETYFDVVGPGFEGVALTRKDSAPIPPYSAVMQNSVKYKFTPATKTFELVPEVITDGVVTPWFKYKKAYFSSGTDLTKLQATTVAAISWGGLYRITASQNDSLLRAGDNPENGGVDPEARMKAMCVGTPSFGDVTYACYSAFFRTRGAAYRQTEHTYTNGNYTVIQVAIPNLDSPVP